MYIHVIEHNLTITMNTGVVLHSLVIHAVVRAASGASQESQLILMTFGTLTELHRTPPPPAGLQAYFEPRILDF